MLENVSPNHDDGVLQVRSAGTLTGTVETASSKARSHLQGAQMAALSQRRHIHEDLHVWGAIRSVDKQKYLSA